jgi:putative tryptophan/tyrosine transport system substrate-binding protein
VASVNEPVTRQAMRRREFLSGLGVTAAILPLVPMSASAQTPGRIYRLGHLGNAAVSATFTRETTLPELAKLGFVEGRNFVFDGRIGEPSALPGLMRELLAGLPDAVVAIGPAAVIAAGAATRTVPIVTFGADPIEYGLAQSYARPGGNVTGVAILVNELEGKRLSILREAVPDRGRVAALLSATGNAVSEPALRKAAAGLGVELLAFTVKTPADYPAAFTAMRAAGAQALVIAATSEFQRDAEQLAGLALEARLPTVCEWADMAHAGCLIGYGPSRVAMRRRMAAQIAAIFRGTAPGDIPIELPTTFEFAVNQKTAKALDINIPLAVLAQADDVIE